MTAGPTPEQRAAGERILDNIHRTHAQLSRIVLVHPDRRDTVRDHVKNDPTLRTLVTVLADDRVPPDTAYVMRHPDTYLCPDTSDAPPR